MKRTGLLLVWATHLLALSLLFGASPPGARAQTETLPEEFPPGVYEIQREIETTDGANHSSVFEIAPDIVPLELITDLSSPLRRSVTVSWWHCVQEGRGLGGPPG